MPITRRALEAFGHMKRLEYECTCPPRDPANYTFERCTACEKWWEWHLVLSDETQCKPWEFPCVIEPSDNDHDSDGHDDPATKWERRARQRYRILDEALHATAAED